jgi:hypothetical protein
MQTDIVTEPNIASSANHLEQIYKDLQTANLTVGYLEARLKDFEAQARALVEAKEKAGQLADIERENRKMLSLYEEAKIAEDLSEQNEVLRQRLKALTPKQSKPKPYTMEDYYQMIQRHLER